MLRLALPQAANEMSPDILQHSITSRICLLALSFPNLRILWSRCVAVPWWLLCLTAVGFCALLWAVD
jgi:hypothetical protein